MPGSIPPDTPSSLTAAVLGNRTGFFWLRLRGRHVATGRHWPNEKALRRPHRLSESHRLALRPLRDRCTFIIFRWLSDGRR